MASPERTPLLSSENEPEAGPATETSPLLSNSQHHDDDDERLRNDGSGKSQLQAGSKWRWPSIIAILLMAVLVVVVMTLGFLVPPSVKLYAEKAAVLEPTGLSIESITPDGIRARIQANFRLDGSRVDDNITRRLGRFATSIVRQLDTDETKVRVNLPHYDNAVLGTAVVPPLKIHLVDGRNTVLDFVADLIPGDAKSARQIVNDWLDGNLQQLKVTGSAAIQVKSGIFPLGTHDVVESMVFEAKEIPSMPAYKIDRLNVHEIPDGNDERLAVGAEASITVLNDFPVGLTVPPLGFDILVPNCEPSESYIMVATAVTKSIEVQPHANVTVSTQGIIRTIPDSLTRACPLTKLSPLDNFIQQYLRGENAEIFVRGQESQNSDVPKWISSFLSSVTIPFNLPGSSFEDAIRNLTATNVDFKLPSPFADPNDPDAKPRVSGTLEVLAALPAEMNLDVGVDGLRASSDVKYRGKKFGELNVHEWQKANSSKTMNSGEDEVLLKITSTLVDVPLDITDGDVFSRVMQQLLFGDEDIILDISSLVDIQVATVLGHIVLKEVPAKGKIPVKKLPGKSITELEPHVGSLIVLNTSKNAVHMQAIVNVTNPTPYTASIPYATVHVFQKGYIIGEVVAKNLNIQLGNNTNLEIEATWDPVSLGGEKGHRAAKKLLSDYLSGKNTTLTFRTHRGSIPSVPILGEALAKINFTLPTPRVKLPGDAHGADQTKSFVRDATFHVFTSAATFDLASPLGHNTIHIENIDATAYYNLTEPVGRLLVDEPFDVPPGVTTTPRLPVTWSTDSIGFDKLKDAMGGTLKLDAMANATLRIGNWVETVQYEGRGIGAKVRL